MTNTNQSDIPQYCIDDHACAALATGSTAKKAGKRRISFRQHADDDDDNEGSQAGSEQDQIEQQEVNEPLDSALTADQIEEDEQAASAAPSSSELHYLACIEEMSKTS